MARRKQPSIPDALLDQALAGAPVGDVANITCSQADAMKAIEAKPAK
jgi:hypothetical protein